MKWEYKTLLISMKELGDVRVVADFGAKEDPSFLPLDYFGKKGWELVTVNGGVAYFKRPVEGKSLLTQANASRKAYETGQVQRGTAADFMIGLGEQEPDSPEGPLSFENFEARVLEAVRRYIS